MDPQIPQLVLHVGVHKTGTTTIQFALEQLRQQLRELGVAIIMMEEMKALPHETGWSARRAVDPADTAQFQAELRDLVGAEIEEVRKVSRDGLRSVLISNERILGARMPSQGDYPVFRPQVEPSIRELIDGLDPGEVHVSLYTRRQDRLMESCYLWEIQKGRSHSIEDQFPFKGEPVMGFSRLADRIMSIPRISSMRVRPFELIAAGSLAYFDDFLSNVGLEGAIDFSTFKDDPAANISYSQKALDIALNLNPHLETEEQRLKVKKFLKANFGTNSYPSARIFDDEERLSLIDLYRADNERVFATWMPDLPVDAYSTLEGTDKLKPVLAR